MPCLLLVLWSTGCQKDDEPVTPVLGSVTPTKGGIGGLVTIRGEQFGEDSLQAVVGFPGAAAARIISYSDSLIQVEVPEGATTGKISVTVKGQRANSSEDFLVLPGRWRVLSNSPQGGEPRSGGSAFSAGDIGYYGLGYNGGTTLIDWWAFNPATGSWTQKRSSGLALQYGIDMVIDGKLYTGLSQSFSFSPSFTKQIWAYDPATDTWTRKADFPGEARFAAIGLSAGGKGYAGLGIDAAGKSLKDWWEYDPGTDTWTRKTDNPSTKPLSWSGGFNISERLFLGTSAYKESNEWYEYVPGTDSWVRKADFPGRIVFDPANFVIGSKGYLAGGGDECWAYDPVSNQWQEYAFFRSVLAGRAFVVNNKAYFMPGAGGGGATNAPYLSQEVWEFTPAR